MNNFSAKEIPVLLVAIILALMSTTLPASGVTYVLAPCPASPNCVSSLADDPQHHTAPLHFTGDPARAWKRLKSALATEPRLTIVEDTGSYLHAEARSLVFRFVDDIEFVLDPGAQLIQVRSASRVGYSDFGVNRRRVERLRKAFDEQAGPAASPVSVTPSGK
jgi:uncharacterized protein (DUF1499 family)